MANKINEIINYGIQNKRKKEEIMQALLNADVEISSATTTIKSLDESGLFKYESEGDAPQVNGQQKFSEALKFAKENAASDDVELKTRANKFLLDVESKKILPNGYKVQSEEVAAILQNPDQWNELTASVKGELMPELAKAGFKFPRKLTGEQEKARQNAEAGITAIQDMKTEIFDENGNIRTANLVQEKLPFALGARKLRQQIKSAVDPVSRIRSGAALTTDEVKFYENLVPGPGDTAEDARYKMEQMEVFFSGIAGSEIMLKNADGKLVKYDDMFNPRQRSEVRKAMQNGYSVHHGNEFDVVFGETIVDGDPIQVSREEVAKEEVKPEDKGFSGRLADKWGQRLDRTGEIMASDESGFTKGLGVLGQGFKAGISDVTGTAAESAFPAIKALTNITTFGGVDRSIKNLTELSQTEEGQAVLQAGLEAYQKGDESYQQFRKENPGLATNIEAMGNIAVAFGEAFGVGKAVPLIKKGLKEGVEVVGNTVSKNKYLKGDDIIKKQVEEGVRPDIDINSLSKEAKSKAQESIKQGFEERDVKFMVSMGPEDRAVASKMLDLADKVNENARVIERPIDLAGDTLVKKVKIAENSMNQWGKQVGEEAKSLKGTKIDSTPVVEKAVEILDNLDVFKFTPELRKKVESVIEKVSNGTDDAYDLHIFKKSIDELVNYGTAGEGLKGKSASMLKSLRAKVDEVLDNNFSGYNEANTNFKEAKELFDSAKDLFGKKNSTGSNVRGGQILRSAFSNNTTRARVYELAEKLDKYEKAITGSVKSNALDQALFAELLEKAGLHSTQSITGFSGQIESAIKKAGGIAEALRNPIQGAGNAVAAVVEKVRNISPEAKKKSLRELLGGILKDSSL